MAANDLYRLTIQIETPGNVTEINLGYELAGGTIGPYTLEKTCLQAIADMNGALLALLAEDTFVRRYTMVPITEPLEIMGFVDLVNAVGTVLGEALPANMTAIISLPTDAPSSKHNGRIYISGVSEEAQTEGTLEAAQQTLNATFAALLTDEIEPSAPEDAVFTPVVISRVVDGVPRVPPVGFSVGTPIAKFSMRQQRRRKTPAFGLN